MKACDHDKLAIHAYVDGELDASNTAAVEAWIATCPDCAAEAARMQSLREALHLPGTYAGAPPSLQRRLKASLAGATRGLPRLSGAGSPPPWILPVGLASLAAVVGASALSVMLATPPPTDDSLTGDLVASHVRSLQVAHLVDVKTSERHVVKPWFNGKLDFSPPVVDLKAQGFPMAGGRLDYLDHRAVAAVVYRRGGHVINLFVWPEPGKAASGPVVARDGYTLRHWRADGMGFWAVSDVNPDDLAKFETTLTDKIAPPPPPPAPAANGQD